MKKPVPPSLYRRYVNVLGSSKMFWGIIAFFVLESLWIALSGRYPMAFDEDYHLGIIKIYAHHISPFLGSQPDGANALGSVATDPSYLYQWLMSFPYRLVAALTNSEMLQVIFLRVLNIALFAWALVLYRKLLLKIDTSKAVAHAVLAVFVLIPVVPLLAAQINYDNLFMPVVALTLLTTLAINDELTRYKRLNMRNVLQLIILCLLGSLVKFAFLPIAAACVLFLLWRLARTFHTVRNTAKNIVFGFTLVERKLRWLLLFVLAVSAVLFSQRYIVNAFRYHQPIPECDAVLEIDQCREYGPWARDYALAGRKPATATTNPLVFTADWFYGMWLRLFFAVDGPKTIFQTRGPLIIPGISSIVIALVTMVVVLIETVRVWRKYRTHVAILLAGVTILYVISLWLQEYKAFLHTGQAVAINGRYLFPVLPIMLLRGALSWREIFQKHPSLKITFASVAILSLLWGGGVLTYILRSNDAWYWDKGPLNGANHALQSVLGPITPGHSDPITFMHHRG